MRIISLNTSVDVIRVLKARTSGNELPIDIVFIYGARRNLIFNRLTAVYANLRTA